MNFVASGIRWISDVGAERDSLMRPKQFCLLQILGWSARLSEEVSVSSI